MTTQITCPIEGCEVVGSIPGVKRHARKAHGLTSYELFDVALSDEPTQELASMKLNELKALAAERNLNLPNKATKAQLVELLSA